MRWMHQVSWAVLALGALLFTTTLVDAVPSRARGTLVLASAFMLGLVLFMHGRPWNRSSRRDGPAATARAATTT